MPSVQRLLQDTDDYFLLAYILLNLHSKSTVQRWKMPNVSLNGARAETSKQLVHGGNGRGVYKGTDSCAESCAQSEAEESIAEKKSS
jgi:hypothetical protein